MNRRREGTVRVLLADDHRLVLDGIRAALADTSLEVVGEARKGSQVLSMINQLRPEVVLLDIRMPELDGLACLELIEKRYPQVKVVVVSVYSDAEHIHAALSRGAAAYIVKSINPADLPAAISQAVEGTVYHALGLSEEDQEVSNHGLTERELVILRAVARGLSNRAIGKELWVTEQTVKFHLTNIYRKLDVANRTEAARAAYRLGVAESPILETA
jgi:DNA-binding NarL/FixJ family response regulator